MPARPLPKQLFVIAIVNIVLGSLGLIGLCCGSLSFATASVKVPGQPNAVAEMTKIPGYMTFTVITGAIGLVLAGMELASGIGILRREPWARPLTLAFVLAVIPLQIISQLVQFIFFRGAMHEVQLEMIRRQQGPQAAQMQQMVGFFTTFFELLGLGIWLVALAYYGYVLMVMLQPQTAEALNSGAVGATPDDMDIR